MPAGKLLMALGAMIFVLGAIVTLGSKWDLGRLPGDISWQRENFSLHVPLATCLLISVVLTVVINLVLRLLR